MNNLYINSPLEQFEINPFISLNIPLLGYLQFSITNFGFYALLTVIIILGLFLGGNNNEMIIANRWSVAAESLYHTVNNMVKIQIGGPKGEYYFPFIFSLFSFILFANLISLVPYSFAVTSHLVATLSLSLGILIGVTIIGFQTHGLKFFSIIVPAGSPEILLPFLIILELISYIAKGISHGLRLAINLLAGHCLMLIIAGFIFNFMIKGIIPLIISPLPLIILIAISGLELAIAFIQAYVFSLLASSYIKDSLDLH
jgi:F-type H+-transporting ATPase subunit a